MKQSLKNIKLPSLEIVGNEFLYLNKDLTTLDLPSMKIIGSDFLYYNESLSTLKSLI